MSTPSGSVLSRSSDQPDQPGQPGQPGQASREGQAGAGRLLWPVANLLALLATVAVGVATGHARQGAWGASGRASGAGAEGRGGGRCQGAPRGFQALLEALPGGGLGRSAMRGSSWPDRPIE